jgi:integrase
MGLRWCDINFDDQTVCVSGSAKLDRKTGHRWVGTTKTKKSERTLPVDPLIIEALKAELASQEDYQRQLRGEVGSVKNIEAHIKPDHCVFPLDPDTAEGLKTPIDVKRLYNWVADAGKRAGFKVSPHDLRHTHLSHVAASGELSLAEVAQRAGHASVITTANTYIHVVSENQRRAAAIGGSLISQVVEQPANVTAIHK